MTEQLHTYDPADALDNPEAIENTLIPAFSLMEKELIS